MKDFVIYYLAYKRFIFVLPYILLLALGAWYRYCIAGLAFFDYDTFHYLVPPVQKILSNEWHKGERPMQYLLFLYYTLSQHAGIKYTIITQQALGIIGGAMLAGAWIKFISGFKQGLWFWHFAGYMMLGIYITSPVIMYYEQFVGPEAISMFMMSALIYCLVQVFSQQPSNMMSMRFAAVCIFINLYLVNLMPKWVFISLFLDVLLVYVIIQYKALTKKNKVSAILVPHLIYAIVVLLPETLNKIDKPCENRFNIEYMQMAYTHFDLLACDKTNFGLDQAARDSLMKFYKEAQRASPDFMIGFSNDYLMWGSAARLIENYYHGNYDSLEHYYKRLNLVLATRYPFQVLKSIAKQVYAFYFPNHWVHKDLYDCVSLSTWDQNYFLLKKFDADLYGEFNNGLTHDGQPIDTTQMKAYYLANRYPEKIFPGGRYDPEKLPHFFRRNFFFYRYFDCIFLLALLAFFIVTICRGRLLKMNTIYIFYIIIFVYVLTIGTIHTFDIDRFIITIYPFLLITTCMSLGYTSDYILSGARFLMQKR